MVKAKSTSITPMPVRVARAHFKVVIAAAAGLASGLALMALHLEPTARVLAGWDIGLLVYLALAARFRRQHGVKDIRKRAAEQDEGGFAILLLSIVATFASLVAVVFALVGAKQGNTALAILTRAAPQLNVLSVAFPLQIGVGLFVLAMAVPFIAGTFTHWSADYDALLTGMLGAFATGGR